MKKINVLPILLIIIMSLISSCGFKLKGYNGLNSNFKNITIGVISSPNNHDSKILNRLKQNISSYGFTFTNDILKSNYYIEIVDAKYSKEIQTKSATGLVKQYLLSFFIKYRIHFNEGNDKFRVIKPIDSIFLERDYTYEPQNILGSDSEEDIIARNLRKEASNRILGILTEIIDEKKIRNTNAN